MVRGRRPGPLQVAVLLLAGWHAAFSVWPALFAIRNDFANYYVSARIVASGGALDRVYERNWFQNEVRRAGIDRLGAFTSYPPSDALLLVPWAGLAPLTAKAAWTLVLVAALLAGFLALRRVVSVSPWLLALVFLLPSSSSRNALLFGQPYPLLLLFLCLSLAALLRGRAFLAGALLAPVVVLKVYGIPYVLYFLWTRRWRAAAGFAVGVSLLILASVGLLGWGVHLTYLREVLPPCLRGELLDPYSTAWQSFSGVAHRLFQYEPELNPVPAADLPAVARFLSQGLTAAVLVFAILASSASEAPDSVRRDWAILTLGSLAASPVVASYHFVLLILPVALMLGLEANPWRQGGLVTLLFFAASPLPLMFARLASGWGNLFACPRLYAVLGLLALAAGPGLWPRRGLLALAAGVAAGLAAVPVPDGERWARLEADGYVSSEPVACEGGLAWTAIQGEQLVVHAPGGRILQGAGDTFGPRCFGGRLSVQHSVAPGASGQPTEEADSDATAGAGFSIRVDREGGTLRETTAAADRVLVRGLVRRPRLSPDHAWVVYQAWEAGSWDIRAVERATGRIVRVTSDPANEMEPSWMPDGAHVVFASDRGRGLGLAALYGVPFPR